MRGEVVGMQKIKPSFRFFFLAGVCFGRKWQVLTLRPWCMKLKKVQPRTCSSLDNLCFYPMRHLSLYSWPTLVCTLEYKWSVIFAKTTTRTAILVGPCIEDDQFLAFLFFLYPTQSISFKNRVLGIFYLMYVFNSLGLCAFLVFSPANDKVASPLIQGLKLPLNNADNFGHSNGVLILSHCFWVPLCVI